MPPIGYPGNSISKEARAKAGGGFESAIEVAPVEPTGSPSISSVTDNGDGILIISGSNFGSKAQAAPIKFERFDGGVDGQLVKNYDASWIGYLGGGNAGDGAILSSAKSHSGSVSASNNSDRNGFDTNFIVFPETEEVFSSYWCLLDGVQPGNQDYNNPEGGSLQFKLARVSSADDPYAGPPSHGITEIFPKNEAASATDAQAAAYIFTGDSTVGGLNKNNYSPAKSPPEFPTFYIRVPINSWFQVNSHLKHSDPGQENGRLELQYGGITAVWENINTRIVGVTKGASSFLLSTMMANHAGPKVWTYTDDIYLDSTRSHVAIGDSPDFESCTFREVCPASAWADSSLTVTKNDDALTAGTYYLFVRNNAGNFSSGYEVTI